MSVQFVSVHILWKGRDKKKYLDNKVVNEFGRKNLYNRTGVTSAALEVTENVKQKNILYVFCLKISLLQFKSQLSSAHQHSAQRIMSLWFSSLKASSIFTDNMSALLYHRLYQSNDRVLEGRVIIAAVHAYKTSRVTCHRKATDPALNPSFSPSRRPINPPSANSS